MTVSEFLAKCQGEMTRQEFCERVGISEAMLSRLYSGERLPGGSTMRKMAAHWPRIVGEYLVSLSKEDAA